jgi:hypothetical protein
VRITFPVSYNLFDEFAAIITIYYIFYSATCGDNLLDNRDEKSYLLITTCSEIQGFTGGRGT